MLTYPKEIAFNINLIDHETKQPFSEDKNINTKTIVYGIIGINNNNVKMGFFTPNASKNIQIKVHGSSESRIGFSIDSFEKGQLQYNLSDGVYYFTVDVELDEILKLLMNIPSKGKFPYTISREYESSKLMTYFNKFKKPLKTNKEDEQISNLIPYSFGIEFETSAGLIPQQELIKYGLIPLRDGSISGVEYSTVVMDDDSRIVRLKKQISLLKKYTISDKDCSLHIHFGYFPLTPNYLITLYTICAHIQSELSNILPSASFNSGKYKSNGKDYCKLLKCTSGFMNLYKELNGGIPYLGSLFEPNQYDITNTAKWNILTRYYWVNFINAFFYEGAKTIEFRFLRPTTNINKIVGWILLMSSIMKYAEYITTKYDSVIENINLKNYLFNDRVKIQDIINIVYMENDTIKNSLNRFIKELYLTRTIYDTLGDTFGQYDFVEEDTITNSFIKEVE